MKKRLTNKFWIKFWPLEKITCLKNNIFTEIKINNKKGIIIQNPEKLTDTDIDSVSELGYKIYELDCQLSYLFKIFDYKISMLTHNYLILTDENV